MFKQEFIQLINQPKNVLHAKTEQLLGFEALIKEYPYFQSAHLLYTKGLHNSNSLSYTKQLRKTAIVANSRVVLYELIHQKDIHTTAIPTPITEEKIVTTSFSKNTLLTEAVAIKEKQSTVSVTSDEIKVIYVNTIPTITQKVEEKKVIVETESPNIELNILKDVENETSESLLNDAVIEVSTEQKIQTQIETEISRGIIQSYVETDIIKTPELNKEKIEEPLTFTAWLEKVKKESHTIQKADIKHVASSRHSASSATTSASDNQTTTNLSTDFKQRKDIINKIIDLDPGRIKLGNQKFFTPQTDAKQSLLENEHLVTETLAKIYALQGNNAKAIRAYEILSLKFPQKSVYFTILIEKLKTNK